MHICVQNHIPPISIFSEIHKHHFLIILSVKCCYILFASGTFVELIIFFLLLEFQFWVPIAILSAARLPRLPFLRPLNNMFFLIAFHTL